MKAKCQKHEAYTQKTEYTQRQLDYAVLHDLVVDIRCAWRDSAANQTSDPNFAQSLATYAHDQELAFRALWSARHQHARV